MRLTIPAEVSTVTNRLVESGFEAYIVGGCVRDLLIGRTPKDWDVTTSATPEDIQRVFPDSFYENTFGTVGVKTGAEDTALHVIEVTPYRVESSYSNARHPDAVTFSTSIADDLKRRDFTVNAIAYQPSTHEIIDLHGGIGDLQRKVLVAVGNPHDRFSEDALRTLRAIRLAAELDFIIDSSTMMGIVANAAALQKISRERVRDETIRILDTPRPLQALFMAQKLGVLKYIIPELEEGIGCAQNQAHAFDVFEHLLRTMQHAADKNWDTNLRLAGLLHDIGKPRTREFSREKGDWTFYAHEIVSAKMAKKILRDLRFPNEVVEKVTTLVRWHMFFSDTDQITLSAVRRTIKNVGKDNIWDLLNLRVCDRIGTGRPKEHPFRLRKYISMVEEALRDPISVGMLALDGKNLMEITHERPGPRIGWILHALLEEVLDDPKKNTSDYLTARARDLTHMTDEDLQKLGEKGKDRRDDAEEREIQHLRQKHHVR